MIIYLTITTNKIYSSKLLELCLNVDRLNYLIINLLKVEQMILLITTAQRVNRVNVSN